jgi:hypothetical protein
MGVLHKHNKRIKVAKWGTPKIKIWNIKNKIYNKMSHLFKCILALMFIYGKIQVGATHKSCLVLT